MDDKAKARMHAIAARLESDRQAKLNQETAQRAMAQSFHEEWERCRHEVIAPAFIEYAKELATHGIDHAVEEVPGAFHTALVGMQFVIGPPHVTGQPLRSVKVKLMPDSGKGQVVPSYDPMKAPTVVLGAQPIKAITTSLIHSLLNDAFDKGGYGK